MIKRHFADVIRLRIFKWKDDPRLPGWGWDRLEKDLTSSYLLLSLIPDGNNLALLGHFPLRETVPHASWEYLAGMQNV